MSDLGNKQILAHNLLRLMQEKQIDRQKLCNDLGFKYSTVSEWLSAKKYPRIDKIELMANYFGVQKSDLIENFYIKKLTKDTSHTTNNNIAFPLSNHEQKVVTAYREKPEMQSAVDTLLGVKQEDSEMRTIYRAARSADHHEPTIEKRNIHDIERLENAPSVTSDDDL